MAEHSPGWAAKAKEVGVDALHRLGTPQNPSGKTMQAFKEKLEGTDIMPVVKEQLKAVPGGWIGLGGGSIAAATYVVSEVEKDRAEEIAKKPLLEQKAIAFDGAAGNSKKEAQAVEKFPDLKPYFAEYHQRVKDELIKHPSVNGRTDEAAGFIYRAKQELINQIKNPEAEKTSSALDYLPVDTKVNLAKVELDKLENLTLEQKAIVNEHLATIANNNGMQKEQQVAVAEQSQDRVV